MARQMSLVVSCIWASERLQVYLLLLPSPWTMQVSVNASLWAFPCLLGQEYSSCCTGLQNQLLPIEDSFCLTVKNFICKKCRLARQYSHLLVFFQLNSRLGAWQRNAIWSPLCTSPSCYRSGRREGVHYSSFGPQFPCTVGWCNCIHIYWCGLPSCQSPILTVLANHG